MDSCIYKNAEIPVCHIHKKMKAILKTQCAVILNALGHKISR